VHREYDSNAPTVDADAAELNQVWTHLIRNAVDAMKGAGVLTVRVSGDGDGVLVHIADTGPGMAADVRAHAFDPFFTTKSVGEGTGLGLDVSRRIVVDSHGGRIDIDSSPSGTTLRVRLPERGTRTDQRS
jgi:signal transduction histidine kinase